MSIEPEANLELEIGHVLLIDVVGYSKLLVDGQISVLQQLNRVVRNTPHFRAAETRQKLMRLPTGDGMALIFFDSPESPVQCALEVSAALKDDGQLQVRMGAHSGPIKEVDDVNDRKNFAGAGINTAQRVLDCGDAGHILLSHRIAEDLRGYRQWHAYLIDLGECEVKHGVQLHLFNVCKEGLGNPAVPQKLKQQNRKGARRFMPKGRAARVAALAGACVFAALSLALLGWFIFRPSPSSVAVLPLGNLSSEKGNEYFVDGVHDEIITNLSRIPDLKVISRTSVMKYRSNKPRNIRQIAKDLGVSHVLEGNVQRVRDHIRVLTQLIDARTDRHVWANRYDSVEADVFEIQSEIAQRIAAELKIQLSPQAKAEIEGRVTKNAAAYDNYVRGKGLINAAVFSGTPKEDLLSAVSLLTASIGNDPNFFLAHYQLAHANVQLYRRFDNTPARFKLAEAALSELVRLRPDAGETHLARAKHLYWAQEKFSEAQQELEIAQEALPNDAFAPLILGYIDRRQGNWPQSTRNFNRALELDPLNPVILRQMALSYLNLRRFPEMTAVLKRANRLAPEDPAVQVQLAAVELEWHADTQPLHRAVESVLANNPSVSQLIGEQWLYLTLCERDADNARIAMAALSENACNAEGVPFPRSWCEGVVARLNGDEKAAQAGFRHALRESDQMVARQPNDGGATCAVAMAHAALGDKEEAIRRGRRAVELIPIEKDAVDGPLMCGYLAIIYSWSGEKDLAFEQLAKATSVPSYWSYGHLKLHPYWDALRGDPRFEQIVASLAPK